MNSRRICCPVMFLSENMSCTRCKWLTPSASRSAILSRKFDPNAFRLCVAPAPGWPEPFGAALRAHSVYEGRSSAVKLPSAARWIHGAAPSKASMKRPSCTYEKATHHARGERPCKKSFRQSSRRRSRHLRKPCGDSAACRRQAVISVDDLPSGERADLSRTPRCCSDPD